MWDKLSGILSLLSMLVLLCLVLLMAYGATRLVAKRCAGTDSTNMKVLDRLFLGQDRTLYIVEVAGETLLIGVTAQHIECLSTVDADRMRTIDRPPPPDFTRTFRDVLRKRRDSCDSERKEESPHGDD